MSNPFSRSLSLSDPATDLVPVEPSDTQNLPSTAVTLYIETGGTLAITTAAGHERIINVPDFKFLPVGVVRVRATGTTASGIHALVQTNAVVVEAGLTYLSAPELGGTPEIGSTLSVTAGIWSGTTQPTLSYQWMRNGVDVGEATGTTYLLSAADDGADIRCRVTAEADGESATAVSPYVRATYPAPMALAAPAPQSFALTSGVQIIETASSFSGDALSYALTSPPLGISIHPSTGEISVDTNTTGPMSAQSFEVSASNSGGVASVSFLLSIAAPNVTAPQNITLPAITGTPEADETLTVSQGTWSGDAPLSFSYQWRRDEMDVTGATAPTFTLTASDDGATIDCRVTATNAAATPVSALAQSVSVTLPEPVFTSAPSVSGMAETGSTLTGTFGATNYPALMDEPLWTRDLAPISGATGLSYTLVAADEGRDIRFRHRATNSGGEAFAASAAVVPSAPQASLTPPVAAGALEDQSFFLDTGTRTYDASGDFSGAEIVFSAPNAPSGISIASGTGIVSIDTAATGALSATTIVVRATNGAGFADSAFSLTVAEPALQASGPLTSSFDGEVFENLDISADGTGLTIAHDNVTVRNVRIRHNSTGAGGDGIFVNNANGVVLEDIETINAGAPDRGVSNRDDARGIFGNGADALTLRRVTGRQGSSTVYLQACDQVSFGWIESHDTRGDFPRGQAIQFNGCTNVAPLPGSTNSHEDIPGTSYSEDTINVFDSPGTDFGAWRVVFGGTGLGENGTSGNGVIALIEQTGSGNSNGSSGYVEGYFNNNGFAGIYDADDCTITGAVRAAYPYSPYGGDGLASDLGLGPVLVQAVRSSNATLTVDYDDVNDFNLQFTDGDTGSSITLNDTAWTSTLPLVRNSFYWRDLSSVPVLDLAPRIGTDSEDVPPGVGDTVYALPGRYVNDPTALWWQWYRDGAPITGATELDYVLQSDDLGATITLGETPENASGSGAEALTSGIQVGMPNLLSSPSDATTDHWATLNVSVTSGVADDQGGTDASEIREDAVSAEHRIRQDITKPAGERNYQVTFRARALGSLTRLAVFPLNSSSSAAVSTYFDLTTGSSEGSGLNRTMTDLGGGWYDISFEFTSDTDTALRIQFNLINPSSPYGTSYAGNAANGIQIRQVRLMDLTPAVSAPMGLATTAGASRTTLLTDTGYDRIATPSLAPATLCGTTTRAGLDTDASNAVVLHVTNLNDYEDGTTPVIGSLRWAITTDTLADGTTAITGPRVVVFDVSGTIAMAERMRATRDNTYIAGQTAPVASGGSGGITLVGRYLRIEASNVVVEHIRVRPGEVTSAGLANTQDGITIDRTGGVSDVIIRNCSVSHTIDEVLSSRPGSSGAMNERVAIVDCLFGEPLKNPALRHEDNHNFGIFMRRGTQNYEIARNLIAACRRRCPGLEQATSGVVSSNYVYDNGAGSPLVYLVKAPGNDINLDPGQGQTEILNTAIHNVYTRGAEDAAAGFNPEGDFCESQTVIDSKYEADPTYGPVRLYQRFNHIEEDVSGPLVAEPVNDSYEWHRQLEEPGLWGLTPVVPYGQVKSFVLTHCGAWPADRDPTDARIIAEVVAGTHTAPSSVPTGENTPSASGTPSVPSNPFSQGSNGLTLIENWLDSLHEAKGGAARGNAGLDVVAEGGGVAQLTPAGAFDFEPAGYFSTLYSDETGLAVFDLSDETNSERVEVEVTGTVAPPAAGNAGALRAEHAIGEGDFAIDFVAGTAAIGALDLAADRLVSNTGRGQRSYVDVAGTLVRTGGVRRNDNGLLMTTPYANPVGEQSQFFELTGGTAWYTTFFDRELQSVIAPDGGPQSVHCSMDRDSRSTMTSNDYGVTGGRTYTISVWLKKDPGQPDGMVPIAETSGSSRRLYYVGPVTDDWQWFHLTFDANSGGDGAVGFSRDGDDGPGQSAPAEGTLLFFYAWGYEVREGGIPNSYAGLLPMSVDRLRLTGAAADIAEGFTEGTVFVRGTGGGDDAEILAEDAETGVRVGFVAGELAVKSNAGTILSGVTPATGDTWEVEVVFTGNTAIITGTTQGASGSAVQGSVSSRDGTLKNIARVAEVSGRERDMAIERIVMKPA